MSPKYNYLKYKRFSTKAGYRSQFTELIDELRTARDALIPETIENKPSEQI
jgi:hypothetical protein